MDNRVVAEIDLSAVRHNVAAVRTIVGPGVQVMAIVKADGYGHGAVEIARAALGAGASWLGIATVSEGIILRETLPDARIVHLPPFPDNACNEIAANQLTTLVSSEEMVVQLGMAARRHNCVADCHLEIDTGMGRSGAAPDEAASVVHLAARTEGIRVNGVATHFAAAESDPEFTRRQIAAFNSARQELPEVEYVHAANSAGTLLYPEAHYNLVRPGLLLYGILPTLNPHPSPLASRLSTLDSETSPLNSFRPAMTLKTQIALVRQLPAGASLSYSRTCVLRRPSRIATLPVGYGDGYPRALSNVGEVLVSGRRAPILGRVCMDVTLVDVTDIPEARVGSEVVLIGRQGDDQIRVEEIAGLIGTTEHDITTRLTSRVPRVYLPP